MKSGHNCFYLLYFSIGTGGADHNHDKQDVDEQLGITIHALLAVQCCQLKF